MVFYLFCVIVIGLWLKSEGSYKITSVRMCVCVCVSVLI